MKKIISGILVAVLLTGCAHYKNYQNEQQTVTTRNYVVPYFDSLVVSGGMHVELKKGAPGVSSVAQKRYNDRMVATVKHHTLYVTAPSYTDQKSVMVTINVPNFRSLLAEGGAYVEASEMKAAKLNLAAGTDAAITLHGLFGVDKIVQKSEGKIEVSWIKNKKLTVECYSKGPVMLSGRVKEL